MGGVRGQELMINMKRSPLTMGHAAAKQYREFFGYIIYQQQSNSHARHVPHVLGFITHMHLLYIFTTISLHRH